MDLWGVGCRRSKIERHNDLHTLSFYCWPRVVPDALHVLALILRAFVVIQIAFTKEETWIESVKALPQSIQPGNNRSGFQIQTYLISKHIFFHYSLSAHI